MVGIGTTNATNTLTVNGGIGATTLYVGSISQTGVATFITSGQKTEITNNGILVSTSGGSSTLYDDNSIYFGGPGIDAIGTALLRLQPSNSSDTGEIQFLSRTNQTGGSLKFNVNELNLSLSGSANISGVVTATSFVGTGASFAGISTFSGITTYTKGLFGSNASFTGVVTASSFSGSASNLTGLTGAGAATYGNATAVPQIVVDANGRITSISNVVISGGGGGGGTGVNIKSVGSVVGFAGTIDFGLGLTVTPVSAGIVTINQSYVATSGISTDVIGGIASVTSLNVTGLSTFGGITTVTGNTLFAKQASVSGVSTFVGFTSFRNGVDITGAALNVNNTPTNLNGIVNIYTSVNGNRIAAFDSGGVASLYYNGAGPNLQTNNAGVVVNGQLYAQSPGAIVAGSLDLDTPSGAVGNIKATLGISTLGITTVTGLTARQLNVSGVSTFSGIATHTATLFGTQLNLSGISTFNSNSNITDNNKILLGSGSNFEMYFDSSNTIFQNKSTNTTGDLYIRSDVILLQKYDGSQTIAQFTRDAGVKLNYQGTTKLETTTDGFVTGSTDVAHLNQLKIGTISASQSDGRTLTATSSGLVGIGTTNPTNTLTVNGGIGATSLTVSGVSTFTGISTFQSTLFGNQLNVSGISTINLNTSSPTQGGLDLVSGSNGKIRLSNDGGATTGSLRFLNGSNQQLATWQSDLTTGSIDIYNYTNSGTSNITLSPGGSVVLNYAGSTSKKFETLGAGVSVTGTTFTNQLNVSGVSTFNGSVRVGTAATQSFVISGVGSVGVGTINPVSTFQVEQYAIENFTGSFTASPGVASNIDAFTISATDFKTVEYTLHFAYATNIQAQKVLVMQNGTTAYAQEYAIMAEPSLIVSIGATVTAGVCYLQATPEAGISGVTTYRLVRSGML